jgi:AcrR family transcriptional regulator
VAQKAGVSVGSLYQYFPNKEAIPFRLQADEWQETRELLERILADSTRPPFERLKGAVQAFFLTEWQEAEFRMALDDATPIYRDTPEAHETRKAYTRCVLVFMNEALPQITAEDRAFAADMVAMVMSAVGERVSGQARSESEVNAMAVAIGEMLCAYLEGIKYPQ